MSSNWAESSSHVALGGDPLLSAFVATFDAFEFAAWQPVLEEWSECGCGASLFARITAGDRSVTWGKFSTGPARSKF